MTTLLAALAIATTLVAFPTLSGAATTTDPVVATDAATSVTSTSATLNGTVTLNDDVDGSYRFRWGTSPGVYSNVTTPDGGVPAGSSDFPVNSTITGLQPGAEYFYELCATNSDGNEVCDGGADQASFTTSAAAPAVSAASASNITPSQATLTGTVNPNGDSTNWTFNWGTSQASLPNQIGDTLTAGTSDQLVQKTISLPNPATTYWFELCAQNPEGGPNCTSPQSFFAPDKPTVTTASPPSGITATGATLSGTVNGNGATITQAFFEYGTTPSYGASWNASLGGNSAQATLSGLASGTKFHYALCATNTWGTRCDSVDHTFTTDTPPTAVLMANPTTGVAPLKVTFDGSGSSDPDSSDSVASYTFSFGDGASVTQSTPTVTHTYTKPCSPCTASLTVTDQEGAQSSPATVVIHANADQPPVASLTAAPTSGTVPVTVKLDGSGSSDTDQGDSVASYTFSFGDGSAPVTQSTPTVSHTYTSPCAPCTASLTVKDQEGVQSSPATVPVTVNPVPSISVANVSQNEGDGPGTTNFVFVVKLSAISTNDVKVDYATADGTATGGSDYTSESGTLTIPANTDCTTNPASKSACQIVVPVIGDTTYENNETFTVNLSNPAGATPATTSATGTIVNDDQPPWLEAGYGATLEGNTGSVVGGAQSWSAGGSLQLKDASGFPSLAGPYQFWVSTPGAQSVSGPYTYQGISGNTLTGVSPAGSIAVGQIAFQPRFITIPVYLCDPQKSPDKNPADCVPITSGLDTTVQYATSNGQSLTTAIPVIEGQDYVYSAGTLTIPAGQSSGNLTFQTIPNTTTENPANPGDDLTRWFNVNLSNSTNGTIASKLGIATIVEDDGLNPPEVTTASASSIGTDHATVSATVNSDGYATNVYVQYGPTNSYGSQTPAQLLSAGNSDQSLTFSLSGLSPGQAYHYQVVATHDVNDGGAADYGQDLTFTTDKAPKAVLAADKTSGSVPLGVTFNGSSSSDPDGSIASWTLAYGDGTSSSGTGSVPNAITHTYTSACTCSATLTVTDNQGAQSAPANVAITASASPPPNPGGPKLSNVTATLGPTSAKIALSVDPHGAKSQIWIAYGTTAKYGQLSQAQRIPAGATRKLTFQLAPLSPRTAYHYQVVAWHIAIDNGSTYTKDMTFSTPKATPMGVAFPQVVRATATGMVPLSLSCRGNSLPRCKGQAKLALGNLLVGSSSFSVLRGHRKLVSIQLKKAALNRLLASRNSLLHLVLTLSVQSGLNGVDLTTKQITLLPPKA